jgi:hypothetical protein
MSRTEPEFPQPFRQNGRLFWLRSKLEAYKAELVAWALGIEVAPRDNVNPVIEEFVPAEKVAKELGFTRRTLGRRIAGLSTHGSIAQCSADNNVEAV